MSNEQKLTAGASDIREVGSPPARGSYDVYEFFGMPNTRWAGTYRAMWPRLTAGIFNSMKPRLGYKSRPLRTIHQGVFVHGARGHVSLSQVEAIEEKGGGASGFAMLGVSLSPDRARFLAADLLRAADDAEIDDG